MIKEFSIASVMLIQGVMEPLAVEPDLFKYAVTQGGLLAVVLVLLWSIRTEAKRKDERLEVMTNIVAQSTAALTRVGETQARLALAVENLERRRDHR